MNYNEASKFEINKAVAAYQSVRGFYPTVIGDDGSLLFANGKEYNPCNNPSDAWPIIWENKITIQAPDNGILNTSDYEWCADGDYYDGDDCMCVSYSDKNPLRAAMIVYLMMQEGK